MEFDDATGTGNYRTIEKINKSPQDTQMSGIGHKNAYMSSYTSSYTINVTAVVKLLAERAK